MIEKTDANIRGVIDLGDSIRIWLKEPRYLKLVNDKTYIYDLFMSSFRVRSQHYHAGDVVKITEMSYYKYNWFQRFFYADDIPSKIFLCIYGTNSYILIDRNKEDWIEVTEEAYQTCKKEECYGGDRCPSFQKLMTDPLLNYLFR